MSDTINKNVAINLNVPKIAGAPELTDLAAKSKAASTSVDQLQRALNETAPTAAKMGGAASKAFKDITDNAKQSRQAVKDLNREMEETARKSNFGHFSGRQMKAFGKMAGVGGAMGMGRLAMAGGGAGIGVLGAMEAGKLGMGLLGSEDGRIKKDDLGPILKTIVDLSDTFSGKKAADAQSDTRMAEMKERAAHQERILHIEAEGQGKAEAFGIGNRGIGSEEFKRNQAIEAVAQTRRLAGARTGRADESLDALQQRQDAERDRELKLRRLQTGGAMGLQTSAEREFRAAGVQGTSKKMLDAEKNKNLEEQLSIQLQINQAAKDRQVSLQQEISSEEKIGQLKLQQVAAVGAGIKRKGGMLAGMNAMDRMLYKELGGKLRRGEALSDQEMEAAKGVGLAAEVTEKQVKDLDQRGELGNILGETGTAEEQAAIASAKQGGRSIEAELQAQQEQIISTVKETLEGLHKKLADLAEQGFINDRSLKKLEEQIKVHRASL